MFRLIAITFIGIGCLFGCGGEEVDTHLGKGLVAEKELQDGLPTTSLGGHTLRKGFDFPPYKVGEPSQIAVEVEGLPLEVNDNPDK